MRTFFLRHAEFLRNVAILMSGKSLAALIALGTMPIIARLFTPSDFGVAAIFFSTVGILSTIASLRYSSAIILPKTDTTAIRLLGFSHRVAIAYCLLLFLLIMSLDLANVTLGTLELLGLWKWIIPLGVWLSAFVGIQESWLTRMKSFGIASTSLVAGNSVSSGVQIGIGALHGTSVAGLIFGNLCGKLGRIIVQRKTSNLSIAAIFAKRTWRYSRALARRFADFPLFNAPAGLVFSLGQNLPVLLFGAMFGPAIAGFYAMANRVSRVPMTIVATSMRRVFLQKVADITNRKRSLIKAFSLSLFALAFIGLLPLAAIHFYGQQVLTWLLGADWFEAGRYLEVIAPWLFSIWITVPCNPIFVVLRKQKLWLIMTSTLTFLRLGAFTVANAMNSDPIETLQLFVIATIIGHLITIGVTISLIRPAKLDNSQLKLNGGS